VTELDKGRHEGEVPQPNPATGGGPQGPQPGAEAVVQAVRVEFSGPLPHPQLLGQYNEAVPDGADRIVKLTENQAQHRQSLESRAQVFTFILALIALVGGIVLIALGNSAEGLVPLVAAIGGLGGLFVYREIQTQKERKALLDEE
jgi:uncharacterized membrane protein